MPVIGNRSRRLQINISDVQEARLEDGMCAFRMAAWPDADVVQSLSGCRVSTAIDTAMDSGKMRSLAASSRMPSWSICWLQLTSETSPEAQARAKIGACLSQRMLNMPEVSSAACSATSTSFRVPPMVNRCSLQGGNSCF